MKHDNKTPDKQKRTLLTKMLLYSFVTLCLLTGLFYVIFRQDGLYILKNIDLLVSTILKAAVAYFFIETAGFLHSYRRPRLYRPSGEEKQNKAAFITEQPSRDPQGMSTQVSQDVQSEKLKGDPQGVSAQGSWNIQLGGGGENPQRSPILDFQNGRSEKPLSPDISHLVDFPAAIRGDEGLSPSSSQIRFGFHGTDLAIRKSLDIVEGVRQGPIFLAPMKDGILVGDKIQEGRYSVRPREELLSESELKYSPITVCFKITGMGCGAQKMKVRCEKPAVLKEKEDGLYQIIERGLLIVEYAN